MIVCSCSFQNMRFPFFVPCLVWFPLAADPWMKTQARSEPGFMTLFTKISNGSKKIEVGIKSGERRANLPCLSGIIDHKYLSCSQAAAALHPAGRL